MENSSITLRECLDFMEAGLIFSIKFCTYDEKRQRNSGKFRQYGEIILLRHEKNTESNDDTEHCTEGVIKVPSEYQEKEKKNPNHGYYMTRNFRVCIGKRPTSKIIKIHLDLIVRFNGRKVILP